MTELFVICNPGEVYKGMPEQEVARKYTSMAIDDYDKLIEFEESYMPHVETPDFEAKIGAKGNKDLMVTAFIRQPIVRVGPINEWFTSSSYLFNPASGDSELLLPDLDIVQISGSTKVREAAEEIKQFYEQYGWQVCVFEGDFNKRKKVAPTSGRYKQSYLNIWVLEPEALRKLAHEKTGYSLDDLCF